MRYRWAIAAMCAMVLMSGLTHANGEQAAQGMIGMFYGLLVLAACGGALAVLLVVLFIWAICAAAGAGRSGAAAEAQHKEELADLRRRVDDAEKELEQYRQAESAPPGSDPSEVKRLSDESEPGDEVGQPEPSEKPDDSPPPWSGCARAGCTGALVGVVLSAFLNMRSGYDTAEAGGMVGAIMIAAAPWAALGAFAGFVLWLLWRAIKADMRGGG